jgi:putative protease
MASQTTHREPAVGCPPTPDSQPVPELLAPAGDWDCARAAVENGADAIYFGLERFNARMRAHNFTEADLPPLMDFLHRRGVKGYVTFNTLVFANELAEARQYLRAIIAAGVDAAIVQDVGICRLIRELSPDFPIHASTQMTVTSAGGVAFARELGCDLVVLARECSLKEIEKIQAAQNEASRKLPVPDWKTDAKDNLAPTTRRPPLPLEVFVHGALCVAYSGQCLTSEALGGRSANRGECAQACRMPYELISDGRPVPLGDRRYLLSPQDLAGLEVLPDLIRAGVASLKIEGRLKSPEYVANITRVYRRALDGLAARNAGQATPTSTPDREEPGQAVVPRSGPQPAGYDSKYEMEMAFSRGLYSGWFRGINNQQLVHARFGKKRGVYLGEVTRVQAEAVQVALRTPLKPGDGVVFDAGRPDEKEEGGRVYEICNAQRPVAPGKIDERNVRLVELRFGCGDIDFLRIHVGDRVWKTSDPELNRRLQATFAPGSPGFQRPIHLEVHGRAGQPITVVARDEIGHVVRVASSMPLVEADNQPLTTDRLRRQLGRLGGTAFKLGALENRLEGGLMLPVSELNRLRREATSQLETLRARPRRWTLHEPGSAGLPAGQPSGRSSPVDGESTPGESSIPATSKPVATPELQSPAEKVTRPDNEIVPNAATRDRPGQLAGSTDPLAPETAGRVRTNAAAELIVLVRSLAQLEAARDCGVGTLYCEFEDPKKYREATRVFRAGAGRSPQAVRGADAPGSQIANRKPEIFVAPPRIYKAGEDWILKLVRSCDADGYLVRNYDHLEFFGDCRRVGDFSLNVANAPAAEYFIDRYGLERVTASYDLNIAQLEALLASAPPDWFEITIHQHMPMFHMEHCVFCAFLSSGTDYTNCGRPCDRHDVRLRDRVGAQHPLRADAGCRNTVFNALAQTGAEYASRMLALGARTFRVEFLDETPEQVAQTIAKYRQLLRGEISGTQLWRELKLLNQLGVTRGQMA